MGHRWKNSLTRRGLETCPQAKTSKSGHAIFFSFFCDASERRVWLSAPSKILASIFGRFRLYRLTQESGNTTLNSYAEFLCKWKRSWLLNQCTNLKSSFIWIFISNHLRRPSQNNSKKWQNDGGENKVDTPARYSHRTPIQYTGRNIHTVELKRQLQYDEL